MHPPGFLVPSVSLASGSSCTRTITTPSALSGRRIALQDAGPYGVIVLQGHGSMGPWPVESPALIRFGQLTHDEYFVSYPAAQDGVTIENRSRCDPLVMLKHFGPHPEAP